MIISFSAMAVRAYGPCERTCFHPESSPIPGIPSTSISSSFAYLKEQMEVGEDDKEWEGNEDDDGGESEERIKTENIKTDVVEVE